MWKEFVIFCILYFPVEEVQSALQDRNDWKYAMKWFEKVMDELLKMEWHS